MAGRSWGSCAALLAIALAASSARALEAQKVSERVWALVGGLGQRSPANLGNNATFGVIVTEAGLVLIDPGATAKGAAQIEAALRTISPKPVVAVINTGGQDHRWLGNSYWKAKGARLVAAKAAAADQRARFDMQWMGLGELVGKDGVEGTTPVYAEETFEDALDLSIGGVAMELRHPGRAHTPGDTFVWLPAERVAFAGDIVFNDRMLGILPQPLSSSADWIKAFDAMADLKPAIVVPGHGDPGPLDKARADTRHYLVYLRQSVQGVLDGKGDMAAAAKLGAGSFARLAGADQLAGRNAQAVFGEMEFE